MGWLVPLLLRVGADEVGWVVGLRSQARDGGQDGSTDRWQRDEADCSGRPARWLEERLSCRLLSCLLLCCWAGVKQTGPRHLR